MKWLALLGSVLCTAVIGGARFGGWSRPALWLDLLFILSAAVAVGLTVSLILIRLHHATHLEWESDLAQRRGHGQSANDRAEE